MWIGTALYFQLVVYLYVDVVVASRAYDLVGVVALPPSTMARFTSFVLALIPLFVTPRNLIKPSAAIGIYLYYLVFVPSCAIMPYASFRGASEWLEFMSAMTIAICSIHILAPRIEFNTVGLELKSSQTFSLLLIFLCIVTSTSLLYFGEIDFRSINLLDVYEKRSAMIESQSTRVSILFYVANMAGYSIAPIALVYGLRSRKIFLMGFALTASFFAFAFTSYKSHLFVPVLAAAVYFVASRDRRWGFTLGFLALMLVIAIVSLVWDRGSSNPLLTWTVQFRLAGNNGFLAAKYADFFSVNPQGLFADSIGRLFTDPVYDRPIAQVVGEYFSQVPGNHANANLWADGYANLGYLGMAIATLELIIVMSVFNMLALNNRADLVAAMSVPAAFSMANTAVHSALTSNGVALGLILIALMPVHNPPSPGRQG